MLCRYYYGLIQIKMKKNILTGFPVLAPLSSYRPVRGNTLFSHRENV
jgi:hypothetical protein